MGIIARFRDIMEANFNALLDRAEDPEKMIDQYLRNMQDDLGKVKAETASVMADATRAKRELEECDEEIEKYQKFAEKALVEGNEADARKFLEKKGQLTKDRELKAKMAEVTQANADKMRAMHDKLTKDIAELNERKASIKAKIAAAKTQEKINDLTEKVGNMTVDDHMSDFARMEDKADRMLDEANARAELNDTTTAEPTAEELADKYEEGTDADVDAELAALKAKLGVQ